MSDKPFSSIDEQVEILTHRGVVCDENTASALMREGYYAIVNGYKQPFLDLDSSLEKEDRYLPRTRFSDIYGLFCFDRDLRAITFRSLMTVESLLRSVISYSFCEVHKATEAYLNQGCFTEAKHYMRGREKHSGDLEWLINTLEHYAKGIESDEPEKGDGTDVRVAHYRDVHGGVPLWVLFCELTFGNLKYFYALMKPQEQAMVCKRVADLCGYGDTPYTKEQFFECFELLVDVRNICAHGERLWCAELDNKQDYTSFIDTLAAFLPHDDRLVFADSVKSTFIHWSEKSSTLAHILAATGIEHAAEKLLS